MEKSSVIKFLADLSSFNQIRIVHTSNFSRVSLASNIDTKEQYIIKTFFYLVNTTQLQQIFTENIYKLQTYSFPSILPYRIFSFADFDNMPHPSFIFKYYKNGSLCDCYEKLNATQRFIVLIGIAEGMSYLHYNKISHSALNPGNIILDDNFYPLISGFGLSKMINSLRIPICRSIYTSPRAIKETNDSFSDDVLAFSMILFLLLTNEVPFESQITSEIIEKINRGIRPTIPDFVSSDMTKLICDCWDADPKRRPSFGQICEYFKKVNAENVDLQKISEYRRILLNQTIQIDSSITDSNRGQQIPVKITSKRNNSMNNINRNQTNNTNVPRNNSLTNINGNLNMVFQNNLSNNINSINNNLNNNISSNINSNMNNHVSHNLNSNMNNNTNYNPPVNSCLNVNENPVHTSPTKTKSKQSPKKSPKRASNSHQQKQTLKHETFSEDQLRFIRELKEITKKGKQLVNEGKTEEGLELLKKAMNSNYKGAFYAYGQYFEKGVAGISKDLQNAALHYKRACELGSNNAKVAYGRFAVKGLGGVEKNAQAAGNLFQHVAESSGKIEAYYRYGKLMVDDDKHHSKAIKFLKTAADKGHTKAANLYGENIQRDSNGNKKMLAEAAKYFKKAADGGDSTAQNNYGSCLQEGNGVPINEHEAVKYFKMSADQNNKFGLNNFGLAVQDGIGGMERNFDLARYYIKKAADMNNESAQYNYAVMIHQGLGGSQDEAEAAKYYKLSAESDYPMAMLQYGQQLIEGKFYPKDVKKGKRFLKRLVEMDCDVSQFAQSALDDIKKKSKQ
ncbi:hypothetical protein TRFO_05001 [Tritrichomonas foetus]|uniref:Protein kinase domain-containing protein n=1 Tax=Tritrichomonas foetus TaxID=1144522 RepID=A0A1J4K9J2_9EUKA|nr:hypothetical protein TRFO_05001 [Tritrichomonas foetus]|eukprot:OHT07899.1 hypothetical protein TRFO_05001 [Tritrichomonas foetus]